MQNNTKKLTKDILKLWSSRKAQLEYQDSVPIADVSSELFCQWSDDVYSPEQDYFKEAFSQEELNLLSEFNLILNYISSNLSNNLPNIVDFIETDEWKIINIKSKELLNKIFNE